MSGESVSDASAQERRAGLSWAWFEDLFASVLRPLATHSKHPESFHGNMRLLGIDGTQWSLRNTKANTLNSGRRYCYGSERSDAAFFKWGCAVLLELGTHQPLAAACDPLDTATVEGELTIARRLLAAIPKKEPTLLLADRYYGRGSFLHEVLSEAGPQCYLLVRVPEAHKAKVIEALSDGSALVEVRVCHPHSQRTKAVLRLREVRGEVHREQDDGDKTKPATPLRLWTTLLDERTHPAQELLKLYAQRWEQELFFRELKQHTGREQLLRASSPQGAEAEFGVMIIAASLLAEQRLEAARQAGLPAMRISLTKISRAIEALLPVLQVAGDMISEQQKQGIITRFLAHTAREARIPPRRSRGCQRGLRKPASAWPRIQSRSDAHGSWSYCVSPILFP
jgi:hypothetical protein